MCKFITVYFLPETQDLITLLLIICVKRMSYIEKKIQ